MIWTQYLARCAKKAGYPSRSVVTHTRQANYPLTTAGDFDLVVEQVDCPWDERHWMVLEDLLRFADLWVAHFDSHIFPATERRANRRLLLCIRLLGIKIIAFPHGGDVNHQDGRKSRYNWLERLAADYPDWDSAEQATTARERVELFSEFSQMVIAPDSALAPFLRRYDLLFKCFPIDTEALRPLPCAMLQLPPLIVHAPNHRNVKGTERLLKALDRLHDLGFEFELALVEQLARDEALDIYRSADIVADQFAIGAFGVFALEGLALGKPVLTYLDAEHLTNPVFNLPIVNTTHDNIERVLAALIRVPQLRERLGTAGRDQVVRFHSIEAMAEVWGRIFDSVWWGGKLCLESTAHFGSRMSGRTLSEDPMDPEFWPVAVDDLLSEIQGAIETVGIAATPGERPEEGEVHPH